MKKQLFFLLLILINTISLAQKQNNWWCFGHYTAINFNSAIPSLDTSAVLSRGSCASIADTSGNLLFYMADDTVALFAATLKGGKIYNKNHLVMQGGDSLIGRAWYQEHVIIPDPAGNNSFYTFSSGVTSIYGFYYSKVDLNLNSGLGAVTQKNIQLQNYDGVDCLIAIKHGNGRDWWVIFKRSSFNAGGSNNEFHKYLITPSGISSDDVQNIGIPFDGNAAKLCVNASGNKISFVHYEGLVETYDFDRCTGILSNQRTIEYPTTAPPYLPCNECAFSPNGNFLYVSTSDTVGSLLQYNLQDANPALTKDALWFTNFPLYTAGAVRRAPDNKIYFSCAYYNGINNNYPYADTMYNMYNMNLGVVNYPDSLGAACNFLPYSFYLGGKRTYWGLPNNPDYDMPAFAGSPCDSLTGIKDITQNISNAELFVFYHNSWQKLFVNAQNIKGKNCLLQIFDINGREVFSSSKKTQPPYFTVDVSCSAFAKGMYIVNFKRRKRDW